MYCDGPFLVMLLLLVLVLMLALAGAIVFAFTGDIAVAGSVAGAVVCTNDCAV